MKNMQMTYGYDDVTLVPTYSVLESRSQSNISMKGFSLPIMASCMDTLGKDMMELFIENKIPFVAHRAFKSANEQVLHFFPNYTKNSNFLRNKNCLWMAVGSVKKYKDWIDYLYEGFGITQFCVDMAHGDSLACEETIKYIKSFTKPTHVLAGNVATKEGFIRLQKAGADGIRVGIASGQICFTGETTVTVWKGYGHNFYQKQIRHIKIGDIVITASGKAREVKKIYENDYSGEIYKINDDIRVTPTHKFHVFDHIKHEKIWLEIKDFDEERYSFLDYDNRTHKAFLDMDEYNGKVYNLEIDDEHTYTVGNLMFGVKNCSTALNTGFGVPILSSIEDCAKIKRNTWLIADGGIKYVGDIAKAIYFGADFCMIGKLLASTDLALGKCYNKNLKELYDNSSANPFSKIYPEEFETKMIEAQRYDQLYQSNVHKNACRENVVAYKEYHGMASRDARKNILSYASVEGISGLTSYISTTKNFINDTKLRLQASLSYAGAKNWKEFKNNTYPVLRSNAGIIAADTHLDITRDK